MMTRVSVSVAVAAASDCVGSVGGAAGWMRAGRLTALATANRGSRFASPLGSTFTSILFASFGPALATALGSGRGSLLVTTMGSGLASAFAITAGSELLAGCSASATIGAVRLIDASV